MTKDEILSMAEKTQFHVIGARVLSPLIEGSDMLWLLERFADLVAEKERKECAKVLTENAAQCTKGSMNEYILTSNAQAILVRGQK